MKGLRRLFGVRAIDEETLPGKEETASSSPATSGVSASSFPAETVKSAPVEKKAASVSVAASEEHTDHEVNDTVPLGHSPTMDGRTRQLPPLDSVARAGERNGLRFGHFSDPGRVRENNQDSIFTMTAALSGADNQVEMGLFIIADGMGGHEDGERASAMTAQSVARTISNDVFMPVLTQDLQDSEQERPAIADVLQSAVQRANALLAERVPDGGTTLTAALLIGNQTYLAHVGDSRAYMIVGDEIEQITRDHSLVQRLIELDQLTPEDAVNYQQKNVLYRAVGQSENLDVDAIFRHIPSGGRMLLCTDGLWNLVSNQEMLKIIKEHENDLQGACEALVALANERGGSDNISVILVRLSS